MAPAEERGSGAASVFCWLSVLSGAGLMWVGWGELDGVDRVYLALIICIVLVLHLDLSLVTLSLSSLSLSSLPLCVLRGACCVSRHLSLAQSLASFQLSLQCVKLRSTHSLPSVPSRECDFPLSAHIMPRPTTPRTARLRRD